jgi:hypothetical protein
MTGSTVTTGEREIEPTEASIVQRIFREFIAGHSPKQIAKMLNREGISGPFGGKWSPSTIHGNPKRGTGILNNEFYIGPHGLESTALREESGHRQARVEAEPILGVDHDGRSALADRSGRTVVRREGAPDAHSTRDRGDWQAGNGEPSAVPVLRTDEMRCVRRGVHHRLCESADVFGCTRPGHVLEWPDQST